MIEITILRFNSIYGKTVGSVSATLFTKQECLAHISLKLSDTLMVVWGTISMRDGFITSIRIIIRSRFRDL
jgi:hypothetical protein